jgi:hypothetical protein
MFFYQKKKFILQLLFKKCKKSPFFNGFSTKKCKFFNGLKFSGIHQYHSLSKYSLQNFTHNLNFEVYL